MNLPELFNRASKITNDNAPTILTGLAIAGTLATAYLTGKATFKAAEIIQIEILNREKQQELSELPVPDERRLPLTNMDKLKLVWPQYLAPAGCIVTTVGCVVFAQRINAKRLAGLAVAYSLSEKRFEEYKQKALEKLGVNKERTMRDELNQERVNANPLSGQQIFVGDHEEICFEPWTGRYFKCDMETLKKAMNDINYQILSDTYATMADFYDKIGLENTKMANEMGWNLEHPMDVHFGTTLTDNGRPCIVVEYNTQPMPIRDRVFQAH